MSTLEEDGGTEQFLFCTVNDTILDLRLACGIKGVLMKKNTQNYFKLVTPVLDSICNDLVKETIDKHYN